jgi:MFS transporter, ACS family, 4-hydroxyphenylacetate permease
VSSYKAADEIKAGGKIMVHASDVQIDTPSSEVEETAVARKVYRRLSWFLVLLFICSYLDRINISFAALAMNKDLGLTATMYGLAGSIFYIAYVLAEIPSNMMMPRFGARIWIPRIMITWGLASAATVFAVGPYSLFALRALTGLAEAGFMPCVLLYLTYWFPSAYRARATGLFIMAQPITIMFGSSLSGLILDMHGFLGLAGWRWLFLLEGLPAVILGVIAFFYLSNRPEEANWLTAREKNVLRNALAKSEAAQSDRTGKLAGGMMSELFSAPVLLLALTYLGLVVSLVTNSTWVPQIVRAFVATENFAMVGLVAALPSLAAILIMPWWSASSDRRQERRWHVMLPMGLAAIGWLCVALLSDPALRLIGLIFCSVGTFAAQGIFWTLPSLFLSPRARPVGIAMVNTIGMIGTTIGPVTVGWLKDLTGTFVSGLVFVACCIALSALCVLVVPRLRRSGEISLTVAPADPSLISG